MLTIMRHTLAGLALGLTAACGAGTDNTVAALPSTSASPTPVTATPATGLRHSVHSHCGVVSTTVDHVLWLAAPPLGDHNPPPGWDENDTAGVFAVQGAGDAVFTADSGDTAHFVKAPAGASDPGRDCA